MEEPNKETTTAPPPPPPTTTSTTTSTDEVIVEEASIQTVVEESKVEELSEVVKEDDGLVVFAGTDRNEVATVSPKVDDNSVVVGTTRSIPNLEKWKMRDEGGLLCTDLVVLHSSGKRLYAIVSFGSARPSVVVTYHKTNEKELHRIGSSSTVGFRAVHAVLSSTHLFVLHAQESLLTIFALPEKEDQPLPKAPLLVQDLTTYCHSFADETPGSNFLLFSSSKSSSSVQGHNMYLVPQEDDDNLSLLFICDAQNGTILGLTLDKNDSKLLSMTIPPTALVCNSPTSWFAQEQSWSNLSLRLTSGIRPIACRLLSHSNVFLILYESIHTLAWHTYHSHTHTIEFEPLGSISTTTTTLGETDNEENNNKKEPSSFAVATQMICSQDESTLHILHTCDNNDTNFIVTFQISTHDNNANNISVHPMRKTTLKGIPTSCFLTQDGQLVVATTTTENQNCVSIYSTKQLQQQQFSDNNDTNDELPLVYTMNIKEKLWSMTSTTDISLLQPNNNTV